MSNNAISDFESLLVSLNDGSNESIETTALAYLHCVQDHPELLQASAATETGHSVVHERLVLTVRARLSALIDQQYRILWNLTLPPPILDVRTTLAWCSVHGYADLLSEGGGVRQNLAEVGDMLKALLPALLGRVELAQ